MAGCVCVLLVDGVAVRDERSRHRSCFSGELGGGLVTPAGCRKGPAKSENREGIVSSGIAYYVQGLVMEKRGPVFVTAFSPLMMIIVAIMGSFILAEKIFLGGVLGAVLIVIGLYAVLWGKYKEYREKEAEEILESVKDDQKLW